MTPGVMFYIMVDSLEDAIRKVEESGGWVVQARAHETELIAWFRDPGGNVVGLYQEPG